jgi:hypothetical protein
MKTVFMESVTLFQVKEGTEDRGAIESVVRVVRKTVCHMFFYSCYNIIAYVPARSQLLNVRPPLPIPPNSKRQTNNGWAMIDAGNFAVHIVSKQVREKYFDNIEASPAEW